MSIRAVIDILSVLAFVGSGFFFVAGSVGLVRFPDVFTRLHALTKADNLGFGLLALGLALQSGSWTAAAKLLIVWLLIVFTSATVCHLVASTAREKGVEPWVRETP
jgi:multicomponent Na+:H+ antiporter subunit G